MCAVQGGLVRTSRENECNPNFSLQYRPQAPLALNDVTFCVKSGERVGVVGRTGSGKTSLGFALFRLYPLSSGHILIDELDTGAVGLHELRTRLAVIPQVKL